MQAAIYPMVGLAVNWTSGLMLLEPESYLLFHHPPPIQFSLARRNRTSDLMLPKHAPYRSAMARRWTAPDSNRETFSLQGSCSTNWS